ncbi:MAG: CsgG/HfaB family protein [Bacteroidales bacterium]|jgi:curli biogenesis system outer membrane secretion channel CsgG
MKKSNLFILIVLFFAIANQVPAQKVDCFILKAPEKPFYNMKRIGVLQFDCTSNRRKNQVITDYIVGALLNQHRGIVNTGGQWYGLVKAKEGKTFVKGVKTDFYDVIERDQLEKIMKEQRLSLSGALDEVSAAEVGKLLGLDVMILGNVSYTDNEEQTNTSTSRCVKRTVTAKGTIKIISVETAKIEGTKNTEAKVKESACDDNISGMPTVDQMADVALKDLADQFVGYFTPGYEEIKYDFEKIKLKEFKERSKEAMDYIEAGDLDRAFPIAYAMYEADSYNPKAAYNLGIIYEMVGDFEEASEYYGIAYEIDFTNEQYQKAAERAKRGLELAAFLEEIGRPVQPYTFSGGDISTALADRVLVKGTSADRTNVYDLPDKSGEVVAKVPGALEFKVIEKQGDFYKIQLRGTKTGFIHKSDVK